jgi:hypothetical protein
MSYYVYIEDHDTYLRECAPDGELYDLVESSYFGPYENYRAAIEMINMCGWYRNKSVRIIDIEFPE